MSKQTKKTMVILFGSVGSAAALCAAAVSLWNSRRMKTLRAVRRTNLILNRVGNALCRMSQAVEI